MRYNIDELYNCGSNLLFQGALSGCLSGLALSTWITVGAYITKPFSPPLPPASTQHCPVSYDNVSTTTQTTWWNNTTVAVIQNQDVQEG